MKTGATKFSFLRSSMRFDGKFNLSEGLKAHIAIENLPYPMFTINDVTSRIFCPGIFHRNYVANGIPFIGGADLLKSSYDSGKYLCEKTTPNHEILKIEKGWTLVTCGGTIGETAYANRLLAKCWLSQHIMRLVPNNNIKEGMLYAYCSSRYGKLLLTTNTYGSVIPTLNAEKIGSIIIPQFPESFQKEVDDLIQESARLREEATDALEEAKRMIENYVNIDFKKDHSTKAMSISSAKIVHSLKTRLDPPVFINNGVDAFKSVNLRIKKLKDCNVSIWYPGIFKRIYVKNGLPYIKGSSIFNINPFNNCDYLSTNRTPMLEQLWLKEGLLLMTCAGICGQVKLITKEYEDKNAIGSPDIIRIKSNDDLFTTEYLFAFLQLPQVFEYMQSMKYGSVIERFDAEHAGSIPIVEPTRELSTDITSIIKHYMDCTYRAFNADEKAITLVESEIKKWKKN
jgi:type I restriction enzyme S subunit